MKKKDQVYVGKAKQVFSTDDPEVLWLVYTDQATALNGKVKAIEPEKGQLNLAISTQLFRELTQAGIPTHFIDTPDDLSMLVRRAKMVPLEIVIRNQAAGHFVSRYHVAANRLLIPAVEELYYKSDALDDPFINESQVIALGLADPATLEQMRTLSRSINDYLQKRFAHIGLSLIDMKLEFGHLADGQLVLADELSPDNFRLQDAAHRSFDKDVFRQHQGPLAPVYQEVLSRLKEENHV